VVKVIVESGWHPGQDRIVSFASLFQPSLNLLRPIAAGI